MNQEVRFSRLEPEQRKALLIEATLACLKRHGFQGASVRKICAEAGVSVGLINHHYDGKDALVAEAYLAVTGRVMRLLRGAIDTAPGGAARALGVLRGILLRELLDPHCSTPGWRSGVRVGSIEAIGRVHDHSYGEYRALLVGVLRQLAEEGGWADFGRGTGGRTASAPCSTGCGWSLG